jgi:isopenicillin N synthase-like dioxygenase
LDVVMTLTGQKLPILDLSQFGSDTSQRAAFLARLREAARGPGFFYLVGHDIGADTMREGSGTGASRLTSAPRARRYRLILRRQPGRDCRGRTNGRQRCRN